MKPNKEESQLREFRKARERIHELNQLIATAPYSPLKKKIFAGHWRFFKVRADILRCSTGAQIQKVVNTCNHWVLGKKKDEKSYNTRCSTEMYCGGSTNTYSSQQHLLPLSQEKFDAAEFPDFFKNKWFTVWKRTKSFGSKNIEICRYYPQIPRHMLEWGYKTAYITEEKPILGDYESELVKLYDYLSDNHAWSILNGNHRDDWDLSICKKRELEKISNREILEDV